MTDGDLSSVNPPTAQAKYANTADAHAAYLRRLGLDHAPEPTLAALHDLHARHLARIPYENLGIMLGRPPSVAPEACVRRVGEVGRLGYCFHQNGAAQLLLSALGYDVQRRHGQVWTGADGPTDEGDLNHLVLVVRIPGEEGRWWFDVGLGDAFGAPLQLVDGQVRDVAGFSYRLADVCEDGWTFHHDAAGTFTGVRVTQRPSHSAAVEAAHHHLSTHADSGFVQRFVVQRRDATGVDTVRGCLLTRLEPTTRSERELLTFADWRDALTDGVGLALDDVAQDHLRPLFDRMLADHRSWVGAGRP